MTDNEKNTPTAVPTVPRKIRGTLTIKAEDDMEFRAQRSTGACSQKEIAQTAGGKLYRTVGEKQSKMVAHIVIPDNETDVRAYLYDTAEKLTADMQTRAAPRLKGKTLYRDEAVQVTGVTKEHRVQIVLDIDMHKHPDYSSRLLNLMQRVNQCFVINQTFLAQLRK